MGLTVGVVQHAKHIKLCLRTSLIKQDVVRVAPVVQLSGLPHALQVILDSQPPTVISMDLAVPPTSDTSWFQLRISFSEPVEWVANTTDPTATPSATPNPASSNTGATTQTVQSTSSALLLTNAALVNISRVSESVAVLANGDTVNAARVFLLWFGSWSGAQAGVEVLGPAFQDIAGNKGEKGSLITVSCPWTLGAMVHPAHTHAYMCACVVLAMSAF